MRSVLLTAYHCKIAFLLCFALFISSDANANERIALVIGNSNYEEISPLTNPRNDADDVAERLRSLDFKLHGDKVHHDLNERSLLRLTSRFSRTADGAEIALLYFAGHGMQFNGDPHLLPVDIPDDSLDVVESEAVGLNRLLAKLAGRAELTVAIFDACREIPDYRPQIKRATRGGGDAAWRGLSRPNVQIDSTVIAYSGGAGELVKDGAGRNSPYTELLLENLTEEALRRKQLDVPDLFEEVSYRFRTKYNGQRPEVINLGVRPNYYYLASLPASGSVHPNDGARDNSENLFWQSVERSGSADEYSAYLKRYPDGTFVDLAQSRLRKLANNDVKVEAQVVGGDATLPPIEQKRNGQHKGRFTVKVHPAGSRVRIMNIVPTYVDGIELKLGEIYDVMVTSDGYYQWREKVLLEESQQEIEVVLKQMPKGQVTISQEASRIDERDRLRYEPELVNIKGGTFLMGSAPDEVGRETDERQHIVEVGDFQLATTEVTVKQFAHFVRETDYRTSAETRHGCHTLSGENFVLNKSHSWKNPGFIQQADEPVLCVSWNDATAYTKWLAEHTGRPYRLPTEAEWEYAARAGIPGASFWGADKYVACNYANVLDQSVLAEIRSAEAEAAAFPCNDGKFASASVASYEPNDFGLYDMLGNAYEWTCSTYAEHWDGKEIRCANESLSGRRVLRGGSAASDSTWARFAKRGKEGKLTAYATYGIRVALGRIESLN